MHQIESTYSAFRSSHLTVGTGVVRVSDSPSRVYGKVSLKADAGNSGTIYVGETDQVSSSTGYPLAAGESVDIHVDDVNKIFVVASGSSQILKWTSA